MRDGIYPDFEKAIIDSKTFLPEINDHDYQAKSTTQKNVAILGYFYALLRFSIEEGSNIPRFLVIDTLRQDDLEEEIYEEALKKLKDLEDNYGEKFQLFLVIRDRGPFPESDVIISLDEGERLLRL